MAKHNEYFVVPRRDGTWAVELPHAERASAVENSQKAAVEMAQKFSSEGVIHVKQTDGKFRHIKT